jgi:anti-anti-sigma factor
MAQLAIVHRLASRPGRPHVGVMAISGDVMVEGVPEVERAVQALLDGGASDLVVDLGALEFIDSASVGALLHLEQRQGRAGARLVLCSLRPAFQRLVDATGLGGAFLIARDVPSALALLDAP